MSRICLSADLLLYVAYDGDDSNDGQSAETPFATLQKAWDWSRDNIDRCGHSIIVSLKPDTSLTHTYAALRAFGEIPGGLVPEQIGDLAPQFQIIGPGSHGQCHIRGSAVGENAITAGYGGAVYVSGVKITSAHQSGLVNYSRGWITAGDIEFGSCAWAHKHSCGQNAAIAQKNTPYWIAGDACFHDLAEDGGKIWNIGNTPTLTATRTFGGTSHAAFAHANQCGRIDYTGTVFLPFFGTLYGSNGNRFDVRSAGGVSVNGAGTSFLPGTGYSLVPPGWYE